MSAFSARVDIASEATAAPIFNWRCSSGGRYNVTFCLSCISLSVVLPGYVRTISRESWTVKPGNQHDSNIVTILYKMDRFNWNWRSEQDVRQMLRRTAWGACLAIALFGCRSSDGLPDRWETYRNIRYGFEFPYPAGWQAVDSPENRDGAAFRNPQNQQVEIRGWASFLRVPKNSGAAAPKLAPSPTSSIRPAKPLSSKARPTQVPSQRSSSLPPANFTTEQGIQGRLQANIEAQTSSLTLVLTHDNVQYYLRGSAPSQQFDVYYRFFNYVARRYRIPMNRN